MNKTNYLEKLLDGAAVEWKPLGKIVSTVTAPSKLKREAYREAGKTPIIDQGATFIAGYTDEDLKPLPTDDYIVFGDHSEHIKYIDFAFIQGADGLKILTPISDMAKYIYYAFQNFYQKELNYKRHWSTAQDTLIPIPALEAQAEIVRILDKFTELTTRKKQYNYYPDKLLSFDDGEVEWKPLGEVAEKIYSGGTPSTSVLEYWENGEIPWMSSGEVNLETIYKTEKFISESGLKNSSAKYVPKNSIVIALAGQGKTRGKVARTRIDLTTNQSLAAITFDEQKISSDYVFHFLKTQYENLRQISLGNDTRGGLNLQMISSYKIPVPPLAEQARIVSILDKFDALTNSISEGLPREIELRQKQYEYYRNLLLNFPKPEEEGQ